MTRYVAAMFICAASSLAWPALASAADSSSERSASLTQDPLVMRLSKDEFRIAFGVNATGCVSNGCNGVIRYRIKWRTEDGSVNSEFKHVSYIVVPRSSRTITVDRQYLDTSEGAHTTNVIAVTVDSITCTEGAYGNAKSASDRAPVRSAALRR
jgi:hypothetical protein